MSRLLLLPLVFALTACVPSTDSDPAILAVDTLINSVHNVDCDQPKHVIEDQLNTVLTVNTKFAELVARGEPDENLYALKQEIDQEIEQMAERYRTNDTVSQDYCILKKQWINNQMSQLKYIIEETDHGL